MRKLSPTETRMVKFLTGHGPYTPGDAARARGGREVMKVLRSLAQKGRVEVDETDDGPRFTLTVQGEADAQ